MRRRENKKNLFFLGFICSIVICACLMLEAPEVRAAEAACKEHTQYITEKIEVDEFRKKKNAEGYYTSAPESQEEDGWIFAGWYTDDTCKVSLGKNVTTGTYTAKFVPAHVLGVKAQVSPNLLNAVDTDDATGSIRFVTSVDSLKYSKIGFNVLLWNGKTLTSQKINVYEKLQAVGIEKDVLSYNASDLFCSISKYFKAYSITNIQNTDFAKDIKATPFLVTKDGTLVEGQTETKTVQQGIDAGRVFVSDRTDGQAGSGTYEDPYADLNDAIAKVADGGTVCVKDTYTAVEGFAWRTHSKDVVITGGTVSFANVATLDIHDSVTFSDTALTFAPSGTIYAWGNRLKIDSSVAMDDSNCLTVYGGGTSAIDKDTELVLMAGTYQYIYGGGDYAIVNGNTSVTVGGTANTTDSIDETVHNDETASGEAYTSFKLFGGGNHGVVNGNTNVTIGSKASPINKFNYIYAGGHGYEGPVTGDCILDFNGRALSIAGGGYGAALTGDTYVTMESGWVHQVFGGCELAKMTGDANVQILGGEVERRVNGGCYNTSSGNEHFVTGNVNVLIGDATISQSYSIDNYIIATSRNGYYEGECGTFIFNKQSEYIAKIKSNGWNYCVTTNGNTSDDLYGNVLPAGDCLYIVPKDNYVAAVTIGNEVKHYTEGESYYPLPELSSKSYQAQIAVTFSPIEDGQTDAQNTFIKNAKAKIDSAYYATVREAMAAAEHSNTAIEWLTDDVQTVDITIKDSKNGKVVTDKKNYLVGDTVVLTGKGNAEYGCKEIKIDGEIVTLGADGSYSFTAEKETYTVEAVFARKIFVDGSSWDISEQYQGRVSQTGGGHQTVAFYDKYEDMDITLKVKDSAVQTKSGARRVGLIFEFDNGKKACITILNNNWQGEGHENYMIQTLNQGTEDLIQANADTVIYRLSDTEKEAYQSEEGIDFRFVKNGAKFYLYLDGKQVESLVNLDFTGLAGDTSLAKVTLAHWGAVGEDCTIPFSVSHELDKSLTKFYGPVEGLYPDMSGTKSAPIIDADTQEKMQSAEEERFLFQSSFKYADLDPDKTDAEYARVLFDMAGYKLSSRAYRIYLYREGTNYYLKANVNGDSSFTDKIVSLDENQIAKLKNDELNVFFVQTGEDTYSVYLENGNDNTVSLVEGSSYTYTGANFVSLYRSSTDLSGTPTIRTTGYFYGSGYMTVEEAANALLASITVTKNIAEGVTVTGLNDAYKIGDTVSFTADLDFGYLTKLVKVNGETLEANAEGNYVFNVTADHLNGLNIEIKSRRSTDKSFTKFYAEEGPFDGNKYVNGTHGETMKEDNENRFLFQIQIKCADIDNKVNVIWSGVNPNKNFARAIVDIVEQGGTSKVYRMYIYKENGETILHLDVYNNTSFVAVKHKLDENQIDKIKNNGLNVFFAQTDEQIYDVYLENGTDEAVSHVDGSTYDCTSFAEGDHVSMWRSTQNGYGDVTIPITGYFYGKGMDAEEAANTLLAPISVETTAGEGVVVEGLNNTYQIGDKVSFTTTLDYGYGIESICVNNTTIPANESGAYEFEVTTEHMNGIAIEVATTNKALSKFVTWTGLYNDSNAAQLSETEKSEMKDDNGAGVIFHTKFVGLDQLTSGQYERVLFDRNTASGNGWVYRIYVYRRAGGYTLTINTYNNGVTLVNEYPLQDIGSTPSKLDVFFVQTGENTYATYYANANGEAVLVPGSQNTHGDHITQYRNHGGAITNFTTTGYFYGTGFASGEEAVNALVESLKQE